jgi:hypothetical protein
MATALVIEEETGTSRGLYHPHNGYYAGDFSQASRGQQSRPGRSVEHTVYAPTRSNLRHYALNSPHRAA